MTFTAVLLASALAAAAPLVPAATPAPAPDLPWPTRYEGRPISRIAPGAMDARMARAFPGRIARFSDGRRQIVLRRIDRASRQLHSLRDCFRAIGYVITPLPMRRSGDTLASCFEAKRDGRALRVCERITDAAGASFPDVASWYWPALLGRSPGPWVAASVVEVVR